MTLVLGAVGPLLDSEPVLLVLVPLSFVSASVEVGVHSESVGLVVSPFSFVHVSLGVDQPSLAVSHSVSPEAVVSAAVRPDLDSSAVFLVVVDEPLSLVDSAVFKHGYWSDLSGLSVVDVRLDGPVKSSKLLDDFLKKLS